MSNLVGFDPPASTVDRLAGQIEELSLVEQVHLLQRLAHAIERKIALPSLTPIHSPSAEQQNQPTPDQPAVSRVVTAELQSITYRIIGCAQAVHRQLGRGLREDNYQRALAAQFIQAGLDCRPQQKFAVYDRPQNHGSLGTLLGYYIPDFVIENQVIVEIKALAETDVSHTAQVIGYLVVSGCPVGLLINFGERSLHPRRIIRPANMQPHHINTQWLWNPFQSP